VQIDRADASRDAIQLGIVPGNGERDGRIQQRAEIVRVVRILPEIVQVDQQPFANALFQAGVELVAVAGGDGDGSRSGKPVPRAWCGSGSDAASASYPPSDAPHTQRCR
jgi:hypothetical protein